jgi:hypothetical protein
MMKKTIVFILIFCLFSACFWDKKSAIGTDFNNTSFINKNFKGNSIEISNITTPCNYVSKGELANLYNVTEDKVHLIGGGNGGKTCTIRVKMSDSEYDYISGSIHFYEELDKTEHGGNWIDTWQIQKGTSKSSEWIPNLGKAAFYKGSKRELRIKLNNYVLSVTAPGSAFNKTEKNKKRDYKKIALAMANKIALFKK